MPLKFLYTCRKCGKSATIDLHAEDISLFCKNCGAFDFTATKNY